MLGCGGEAGGRRATAVLEDGRAWGVVVGLAAVEEAVVALVCTTLYHDMYMQHACTQFQSLAIVSQHSNSEH